MIEIWVCEIEKVNFSAVFTLENFGSSGKAAIFFPRGVRTGWPSFWVTAPSRSSWSIAAWIASAKTRTLGYEASCLPLRDVKDQLVPSLPPSPGQTDKYLRFREIRVPKCGLSSSILKNKHLSPFLLASLGSQGTPSCRIVMTPYEPRLLPALSPQGCLCSHLPGDGLDMKSKVSTLGIFRARSWSTTLAKLHLHRQKTQLR